MKIGGRTIEMLELLRCTEIVNCASNNAILAWFKLKDINKKIIKKKSKFQQTILINSKIEPESLRYFTRTNIEPFPPGKLLWLIARSNMKFSTSEALGMKDFVQPLALGVLTPVIGPAGSGILARRILTYDESKF